MSVQFGRHQFRGVPALLPFYGKPCRWPDLGPVNDRSFAPGTKAPQRLAPIPWGRPDRALGRLVCRHMVDANPPTVIPFNPVTGKRLQALLRTLHIAH